METIRLYFHLITDLVSVILLAISTGAVTAILAASYSASLEGAATGAGLGLLVGAWGLGYTFWRAYRPQIKKGRLAS